MQVQELVGIVPWTFIAQICNLFIQMYLIKRRGDHRRRGGKKRSQRHQRGI